MAERQILVELDPTLAVRVDVEQLAGIECLRDAVRVVESGHLLMSGLRVGAEQLWALERLDEGERMPRVSAKMYPRGSFDLGSIANRMS